MHPKDLILCQAHGSEEPEYERWQPEYGIDNFVKTEFTCGACHYLAYALHKHTGWAIYSVGEEHYYVINNDGKAVDIYGVRPTQYAPTKYDIDQKKSTQPSIVESIEDVSDNDYYLWAEKLITHFPNYFGIK